MREIYKSLLLSLFSNRWISFQEFLKKKYSQKRSGKLLTTILNSLTKSREVSRRHGSIESACFREGYYLLRHPHTDVACCNPIVRILGDIYSI